MKHQYFQSTHCVTLLSLLLMLLTPLAWAEAIYKCEQEDGGFNFSQQPCPEQITLEEEPQNLWRELKVLTEEGMGLGRSVGADIDSIKQCHRNKIAYVKSLEAIKPRVDALVQDYGEFADALDQLHACAICRPSGANYCNKAKTYLDQVTAKLH